MPERVEVVDGLQDYYFSDASELQSRDRVTDHGFGGVLVPFGSGAFVGPIRPIVGPRDERTRVTQPLKERNREIAEYLSMALHL